jgi:hypothetical protein
VGITLFYITESNGVGYCFRASCHHLEINGERKYEKKKRSDKITEIRDFYSKVAQYYHSCLDARVLAYLHQRGYNDQMIKQQMIGYCPNGKHPIYKNNISIEAGLADKECRPFLSDRIIFPYFKNDTVITDLRGRTLDSNEELRYKSPFGGAYFRGAIYPYNHKIAATAKQLIITEGEIKTDIAQQYGFDCIGIPGITSWRSGFMQQENQQIIILFDTEYNKDTQLDVFVSIKKISQHIDNIRVAVLPLQQGKKSEIDTFILQYGANIFRSILDNAIDYTTWFNLNIY